MKLSSHEFPRHLQSHDIEKYCGTSLQVVFKKDLSQYDFSIQQHPENISVIEYREFLRKYQFDTEKFAQLNTENIGNEVLKEIYETYIFLSGFFGKSSKSLEGIGIQTSDLIDAIIFRLKDQIIEAGGENSKRKLKNGTVVGLAKVQENSLVLRSVPYFAFACTNVSLDSVKVKNQNNELLTLRQIDTLLHSKNQDGDYLLPNSLGVSVCMGAKDDDGNPIFLAQERNNAAVLSQNSNKYIASASGGIPVDVLQGSNVFRRAINAEIQEELGTIPNPVHANQLVTHMNKKARDIMLQSFDNIYQVKEGITQVLGKKLDKMGLRGGVVPVALTLEEARRNPEIIFIANTNRSLSEIRSTWENAEDKEESLSIQGFSAQEIEDDMERRKRGEPPKIDNHFFMSYLGYVLMAEKVEQNNLV